MLKFWFSRLSGGWKGKKWPKTLKISVCHTLHFRNHISHDLHLWYACMYKRIIPPGIFFFFFKILIFGIIRGGEIKGQIDKMTKSFVSLTPYLRNCTSYNCDFGTLLYNDNIIRKFFRFSKFWFLRFLGGLKGKKWPKIRNFSLFCSIFQETVDHIIKILIMISTGVFCYFFFKKMQHCKY